MNNIRVVMACHNEAEDLERSLNATLESLRAAGEEDPSRCIILILDKCSDSSLDIASSVISAESIIIKEDAGWKNSYAENLELGVRRALEDKTDFVAVVDADMVVDARFFDEAVRAGCHSLSSVLYTEPSTPFNRLHYTYWRGLESLGLMKRMRKHGHRVYQAEPLRVLLRARGRVFDDVLSPDVELDRWLGGEAKVLPMVTWHVRKSGLLRSLRSQVRQGRAMRQVGKTPRQVIGEVLRLRAAVFFSFALSSREHGGRKV